MNEETIESLSDELNNKNCISKVINYMHDDSEV